MAARKVTDLPIGSLTGAVAITPSDGTTYSGVRGVWVGTGGDLVVEMLNPETPGATVTWPNVPDGTFLPISVERVLSTGTTASDIVLGF